MDISDAGWWQHQLGDGSGGKIHDGGDNMTLAPVEHGTGSTFEESEKISGGSGGIRTD